MKVKKQLWTLNEYGGFECPCGNSVDKSGFYPCDKDGVLTDPDNNWCDLYKCMECGHIQEAPEGTYED